MTSGLISFLNDSFNQAASFVNSLNVSLEKFTSQYLAFLNLDQKKVVLNIHQNIALNHLSVYEETFQTALEPKKIQLKQKKFHFDSNFKSFSGLRQLKGSHLTYKRNYSTSSKKSDMVGYLKPPILYWPKRYPFYMRPLKKPEPLPWVKERLERKRLRLLRLAEEKKARQSKRFIRKKEKRMERIMSRGIRRKERFIKQKENIFEAYDRFEDRGIVPPIIIRMGILVFWWFASYDEKSSNC